MSFFRHFLYRFIRKRSTPIAEDRARVWKQRLSIGYGLVAWNALGLVLYMAYNGKADWAKYHGLKTDEEIAMPPGKAWANTLGIQNAKVYRISGLKKVDQYDIVEGEQQRAAEKKGENEFVEE